MESSASIGVVRPPRPQPIFPNMENKYVFRLINIKLTSNQIVCNIDI